MTSSAEVDGSRLFPHILSKLQTELGAYGFELSPFLVGWYNELVSVKLRLDAPSPDCVAICLISPPSMFEDSFLPLLMSWFEPENVSTLEDAIKPIRSKFSTKVNLPGLNDPLDWSVFLRVNTALNNLQKEPICGSSEADLQAVTGRFIPDYIIRPVSRLPLVHAQCAGHVSGLAYFHEVEIPLKNKNSTVRFSLHPVYGGWFGFRGVIVFPNLRCPQLPRPITRSSVPPGLPPFDLDMLRKLATEYHKRWRENLWRDSGLGDQCKYRYSETACSYFNTPPAQRAQWVERWIQSAKRVCSSQPGSLSSVILDRLSVTPSA